MPQLSTYLSCLVASLLVGLTTIAQSTDWMAIPFEQTNHYATENGQQFIPMKCDYYQPGGIGDFYGIYEEYIQNEFDTCADRIWDTNYVYAYPKTDFRMYVDALGGPLTLQGREHSFMIPRDIALGEWAYFGNQLIVQYVEEGMTSVLGSLDSFRVFAIYEADSTTMVDSLLLSKTYGLIQYPTVQSLEDYPGQPAVTWHLLGTEGPIDSAGLTLPNRQGLLPYTVGDQLLFYHYYYTNWTNLNEEYHNLTVNAIDFSNGTANISGVCDKYSLTGVYLSTDSLYTVSFDPVLGELVEESTSNRYLSEFGQGFFASMNFMQTNDSGKVATAELISFSYCDSMIIVDGPSRTEVYTESYGMLKQFDHGAMPPSLLELYAAEATEFSYGTWPIWLGVDDMHAENQLNVYPNPAIEELWIETDLPTQVQLFDLGGALVLETTVTSKTKLPVSDLAPGIYILQHGSSKQKIVIGK